MELDILEEIGLTKNQIKVYLSLLKLGLSPSQEIIIDTNLHRSPTYDALEKLEEKGLISTIVKDYKKHFQAESPNNLYSYLEEKKIKLSKLMPELEKLENTKKEKINATIYKGTEGLKAIHNDMLKEGMQIDVLGGKGLIFSELKYFITQWDKKRVKQNIKWRIIWDNENIKNEIIKKKLVTGKVIPKEFQTSSVINIYGNKVAIFSWENKTPDAFVIDNKEIANSFRKWFELIYEKI